ncbi:MAG: hypothetical protein HKN39_06710 [Flavobacteriales bacterium]|nr:hypothetical protein [Flavobacteriales bacterium]
MGRTGVLITFIGIFLATVFACNEQPEYTSPDLKGLWKLHIMEQKDSLGNWGPWRNGMQGYLLYDGIENMSIHLMDKGYENFELEFPNFTDTIPLEALQHITKSYVYFGKYEVDQNKSIVQHTRISHSNPKDWGAVVKRRFSFSGDTLVISPVEENLRSLRLKWLRDQ